MKCPFKTHDLPNGLAAAQAYSLTIFLQLPTDWAPTSGQVTPLLEFPRAEEVPGRAVAWPAGWMDWILDRPAASIARPCGERQVPSWCLPQCSEKTNLEGPSIPRIQIIRSGIMIYHGLS